MRSLEGCGSLCEVEQFGRRVTADLHEFTDPGAVKEALEGTGATVRPHDFRRTVASLLDAQLDTKTAAAQLGHSTEATTLRHYVKRTHVAPDVTQPDADSPEANVMGK